MEESTTRPNRNGTDISIHSNNSTRIVRVNWLRFLFYSWRRISNISKLVVTCYIMLVILQVAAGITILIISAGESCDQPLRTFIIVHMVRIVLSCPFSIGSHLQREQRRRMISRQREQDNLREEQVRLRHARRRQSGVTTRPESVADSINSNVIQSQSSWANSTGEKLQSFVDLFAVLWFIVGNYLLFVSDNCSSDAPRLYYTTLTFILMGYFIVMLPLMLCISVILCLPCVLTLMRVLNITEINGMNQGARNEDISKIPVLRFKTASSEQHQEEEPIVSSKKSNGLLSRLLKGYRRHEINDTEEGIYETIQILPVEDAMCCICLSEYENNDLICKLWCGHHYHKSCVTDWFRLNRKCPLCKQDFRGKKYDENSENSEDDGEGESSSRHGNEFQMDQINASVR